MINSQTSESMVCHAPWYVQATRLTDPILQTLQLLLQLPSNRLSDLYRQSSLKGACRVQQSLLMHLQFSLKVASTHQQKLLGSLAKAQRSLTSPASSPKLLTWLAKVQVAQTSLAKVLGSLTSVARVAIHQRNQAQSDKHPQLHQTFHPSLLQFLQHLQELHSKPNLVLKHSRLHRQSCQLLLLLHHLQQQMRRIRQTLPVQMLNLYYSHHPCCLRPPVFNKQARLPVFLRPTLVQLLQVSQGFHCCCPGRNPQVLSLESCNFSHLLHLTL